MRRAVRVLVLSALVLVGLAAWPAPASAHPLGNFTVNTYSGIVVEPGKLVVTYVLDMAEIPTQQEMPSIDTNNDQTASSRERTAWAHLTASRLLEGVHASGGGHPLVFHVASASMRFREGQAGLPILRMTATFAGWIGERGTLRYADGNYAGRIGWREITAVGANGAVVVKSSVPKTSVSDALLRYPNDMLSSPLHTTAAVFGFEPGESVPAPAIGAGGASSERPGVAGGGLARLATWSGVSLPVLFLALLLAVAFGAAHALLPGHGKTIMAAYLVGAGGRMRQAVAVGVAIAFMHTASVLGIGVLVLSAEQVFPPEKVYPWLTLASGVVVLGLGTWLLWVRTRARRRGGIHRHVGGEDHDHDRDPWHSHGHEHAALDPERPLSRKGLAALAVSGGLLPSPTAVIVLLSTVAAHRVAFGLALILAFSVGLAGALVGVGALALRARVLVARRLRGSFLRLVPVASAAVIVLVGAVLVARGAAQV